MKSRITTAFFICLLLFPGWVVQAEEENPPIKITSDRLISDNKSQVITFIGNVRAVRKDLVMLADKIDILQEGAENSGVDMIVARGNVRINQNGKHATADKAIYYETSQKIILTGNPHSWEDKNEITGDEMIFYINEDRLVVKQGQEEQVNVIFYPNKDQQKDQ